MYLIPLFQLYTDIGLYDTWIGMALFYAAIATPFCLFVMRGFFSTVAREIEEAAQLDGAIELGGPVADPDAARPRADRGADPVPVHLDLERLHVRPGAVHVRRRPAGDDRASRRSRAQSSAAGPPVILAGALIGSLPTMALFLALGRYLLSGLTLTAGRTA